MRKLKRKKGEITLAWIITVILVGLGFLILLIFFYNMFSNTQINRDICHESVVLRATVPEITQKYIPLKCKTNKICITSGLFGGGCEEEYAGEKGITKIKVKTPVDIERIYADEILECWSMMGEGKLSVMSQYAASNFGIGKVYPSCVICSRIAYDKESLNKAGIDLSQVNVAFYMKNYKVPGKEVTYFEYMNLGSNDAKVPFTGLKQGEKIDEKSGKIEGETKELKTGETIRNPEAFLKTDAIMFMQISAPGQWESLENLGKIGVAGLAISFLTAPVSTGKAIVGTIRDWMITLPLAIIGVGIQQINVAYNRAVTATYCGDLTLSSEKARSGCSAVRTVSYNITGISEYCKVIESIP